MWILRMKSGTVRLILGPTSSWLLRNSSMISKYLVDDSSLQNSFNRNIFLQRQIKTRIIVSQIWWKFNLANLHGTNIRAFFLFILIGWVRGMDKLACADIRVYLFSGDWCSKSVVFEATAAKVSQIFRFRLHLLSEYMLNVCLLFLGLNFLKQLFVLECFLH